MSGNKVLITMAKNRYSFIDSVKRQFNILKLTLFKENPFMIMGRSIRNTYYNLTHYRQRMNTLRKHVTLMNEKLDNMEKIIDSNTKTPYYRGQSFNRIR
jgi:hypothetical protein